MKQPAVYLMASQRNGTLYVGVTSDLIKRDWQHRTHAVSGFTEKYDVTLLVWFEQHETMESAISREKAIKKWNRAWKLNLIEQTNPNWLDLWPVITGEQADFRVLGIGEHSIAHSRHSRVEPAPAKAWGENPAEPSTPPNGQSHRHSRAGGNPANQIAPQSGQNRCPAAQESLNSLDSRLRGNDEAGEIA